MDRRPRDTEMNRVLDGLALILPWPILLAVVGVLFIAWAAAELSERLRGRHG